MEKIFISSLTEYIIRYSALFVVAMAITIGYMIIRKRKNKITKTEKIICGVLIVGFIAIETLAVWPAVQDIKNMPDSVEKVEFVTAYRQSGDTNESKNDNLIGTPVTVELSDGSKLFLTAVDYFPVSIDDSVLYYAENTQLIVSYEGANNDNR